MREKINYRAKNQSDYARWGAAQTKRNRSVETAPAYESELG